MRPKEARHECEHDRCDCCACSCHGGHRHRWRHEPDVRSQPAAGQPVPVARLIKPLDRLLPGEPQRLYWLPVRAPAVLYVAPAVSLSVFKVGGEVPAPAEAAVLGASERFPGTQAVAFLAPAPLYFVSVARNPEWLEAGLDLEFGIRYGEPQAAYGENALAATPGAVLQTPLVTFPAGEPAFALPPGTGFASFLEFVANEYGALLDSLTGALYELAVQLPMVSFPIPPAGAAGPSAPPGAQHNDNYCGISAFIHSMQNKFPGALPPDAGTDATEWDKVGEALDHSNTFGERGGKLVDNINKSFRDRQGAANGKRYCAEELSDTSAANLVAKAKDCDLKLLVYDLPTFGHWVDVTGVTKTAGGADLTIQDYANSYTLPYDDSKGTIDFTNAAGSTMDNRGKDFGGKNPLQRIYFVAVCECQPPPPGRPRRRRVS